MTPQVRIPSSHRLILQHVSCSQSPLIASFAQSIIIKTWGPRSTGPAVCVSDHRVFASPHSYIYRYSAPGVAEFKPEQYSPWRTLTPKIQLQRRTERDPGWRARLRRGRRLRFLGRSMSRSIADTWNGIDFVTAISNRGRGSNRSSTMSVEDARASRR